MKASTRNRLRMVTMAEQHGGMRRPSSPAPVSGPGALSQRTDGGPAKPAYVSGLPYGEGQDFYDLQTSAPLGAEAAKPRSRSGATAPQGGASSPTPLFAPTARPDEPVTAGAPVGPGPGPQASRAQQQRLADIYARMLANDPTGDTAYLMALAQRLGL